MAVDFNDTFGDNDGLKACTITERSQRYNGNAGSQGKGNQAASAKSAGSYRRNGIGNDDAGQGFTARKHIIPDYLYPFGNGNSFKQLAVGKTSVFLFIIIIAVIIAATAACFYKTFGQGNAGQPGSRLRRSCEDIRFLIALKKGASSDFGNAVGNNHGAKTDAKAYAPIFSSPSGKVTAVIVVFTEY